MSRNTTSHTYNYYYLVGGVFYLLHNVFSQAPVGVQVRRTLGHSPRLPIAAGKEQERVCKDESLGQHQLHGKTYSVLVCSLVQRIASVKELQHWKWK